MPEGDTVWLAARHLHAALAGKVLARSDFRVPALATIDLAGSTVAEVVPRGKHLLFRLSGGPGAGLTLHTHFRMDGSWHLYRPGQAWHGGPPFQVRAILEVPGTVAVGYRLPIVELIATAAESDVVGHLGPDMLAPDLDIAAAAERLTADPSRPVGEALLDQRVVAGIGNLYRTETCFLARVTPFVPVGDLDGHGCRPAAVLAIARKLLTVNAHRATQATTGLTRRDAQHWVFERRTCLRCGSRVSTVMAGTNGQERVTYWCPSCQQGTAPQSVSIAELLPRTLGRTRYRP